MGGVTQDKAQRPERAGGQGDGLAGARRSGVGGHQDARLEALGKNMG